MPSDELYQDILEAYRRMSARAMDLERELHETKAKLRNCEERLNARKTSKEET